jgi:crossover junction endodeoxyribonuclease RuvC
MAASMAPAAVEGACLAIPLARIPLVMVEPASWKKKLRLPGKNKEASRQRALNLFPRAHELLAKKKHHGRAEAALIVVAHLEAPR